MKLRNVKKLAATTLVGWYLLVPLVRNGTEYAHTWHHAMSYDSARECEDERARFVSATTDQDKHDAFVLSMCIAYDDPKINSYDDSRERPDEDAPIR